MKRFSTFALLLITIVQTQQIVWIRTFQPHPHLICPDMSTDSRNNVIVCAYPYLKKYNPDGEVLWERELNFGNGGTPCVNVDKGDSIIVGGSNVLLNDSTWTIIKFTPAGDTLWKRVIVFPLDSVPIFADMGIDNQNNILVAGSRCPYQWLTFKLSSIAEIKWVRIFSSNWGPDMVIGICADDSLNIIVGGERGIYPLPNVWYPQIYKYSEFGDSLWAVCYFDSFHANYTVGEHTADKFGNVILPGAEHRFPPSNDYAYLFKYDQQGNLLWKWFDDSTAYSKFSSCITDSSGNIFTTGARNPPDSIVTMEVWKFNPNGEPLWVFSYLLGTYYWAERFWFKIDLDREDNIIVAAHKDTLVYVFKITEWPGISEEKKEKLIPNLIFSTIINSKQNYKIGLPFDVTSIEIYDISGKLWQKEKVNKSEYIWLGKDAKGKPLPQGIYFLKVSGKEKDAIKKIVLLK